MDKVLRKEFEDKGKTPIYNEPLKPLTIITRKEWGAKPAVGHVPVLKYKPNIILFSFDTKSIGCETREDCVKEVQGIQKTDIADGQPDIDYNFLVAGDGNVYEGRGWTKRVSFSRKGHPVENPDQTFDIGLVGDYKSSDKPNTKAEIGLGWPYKMLRTVYQLIHVGVDKDYIQRSYFFG